MNARAQTGSDAAPGGAVLDCLVVGGGLAGLAAGFGLLRAGLRAVVVEAGANAGGVLRSVPVGDFLFEDGPNTVPASARNLRELAAELGLTERWITADPAARIRHLWFRGRLVPMPTHPLGWLGTPLLSAKSKLRLATEVLRPWRAPGDGREEPDLGALLDERLGAEATDLLAGAFVRGVYAGHHRGLGAKSAFPRLWSLLEQGGGLVRGLRSARAAQALPPAPGPAVPGTRLLSFPQGLGEVAKALAAALGESLWLRTRADSIRREGGLWQVALDGRSKLVARAVVLACEAPMAARLLASAGQPGPAAVLSAIPRRGVRVVHLGFAPGAVALPPGFGFLVPPEEALARRGGSARAAPKALGMLFPSNLFPHRAPPGGAAVTGFFPPEWAADTDGPARAAEAARDLGHALGLRDAPRPAVHRCVDWPGAIPQYAVGHEQRLAACEAELAREAPGLWLSGGYTRGVAVDQVLGRARAVAREIAEQSRGSQGP